MARFNDLTEDLVSEILALLPVDLLMQLKCVQKSWCSLIANSTFVAKHLCNQINNKNRSILLISRLREGKKAFSILSFDDETETSPGENHASAVGKIVESCRYTGHVYFPFLGHCHGIICLSGRSTRVILANPAIREFRELPVSFFLDPSKSPDATNYWPLVIGVGYDPKLKDYKVIQVLSFFNNPGNGPPPIRAEVYTLSTDSWRPIYNVDPFETGTLCHGSYKCLYLNGVCYWMASSKFGGKEKFILSFDMSDEVFGKIPMPNSSFTTNRGYWGILEWNESLALVLFDSPTIQLTFEIWIMDEFVNGTWKKLSMIETTPRLETPLAFWKHDELVMEGMNEMLCCYNLGTKVIKDLPVHEHGRGLTAITYTSSLVSVRGGNKLVIKDLPVHKAY